jgi:phage replication O-like protein O
LGFLYEQFKTQGTSMNIHTRDNSSNPLIPNFTQIPNVLFDTWMAKLTPAEFKILMAVARKTYGWQKIRDRISLRQLVELTGLHKNGVIKAVDSLIEYGLVIKIKSHDEYGDRPNQYEINIDCNESSGGSLHSGHPPVHTVDTPGVHTVDTQNKDITKETSTKERESGGDPPPPTPTSVSKKSKKEAVAKIAYRENVLLTENEYGKLESDYGATKLEWMLDHLSDKKFSNGYKYESDYHVLLSRNWVHDEYIKRVQDGKIVSLVPAQGGDAEKNKRAAEFVESKIQSRCTSSLFFQAEPSKAVFVYHAKDIKKEYVYEAYDNKNFKEKLLKDLEMGFPNIKEILNPRPFLPSPIDEMLKGCVVVAGKNDR